MHQAINIYREEQQAKNNVKYIGNKRKKKKSQDPKIRNCVPVFSEVHRLRPEVQTPFLFQSMEKQNLSFIF